MVVLSFVKYGNIHNALNFTFSIPCDAYLDIFYGLLRTFSSGPLRFCQQKPFSSFRVDFDDSPGIELRLRRSALSKCSCHMYFLLLHNCAISIDIYSPINKFYSVIIFSLLVNAFMLLLNCLISILYLYIHFLSLRHYFLYSNIIWSFI